MDLNEYVEELRELVNTDSGTSTVAGVAVVAKIMLDKFLAMGWSVATVNLGNEVGPGVFATNKPDATGFDVLLVGHLDTVFPEGTAAGRPFSTDGAVARGPGVADMKSGLMNMVYALRTLDKATFERLAIGVLLNSDEETGSAHSYDWIVDQARRSRCVLVFEPARADGSLVRARKGVCGYQIDFKGVEAHAGNDPLKGRSAVLESAYWIPALSALADDAEGTTVIVGKVTGGTARNVVPGHAVAQVDIRFWKASELERIERALSAMRDKPFTPDVAVTLTRKSYRPAMEVSTETEALMRIVEAAGAATGVAVEWKSAGGGSDANIAACVGVPSLDGFGPIGGNFHNEEEYTRLDSVRQRVEFVQAVLRMI